jgi:hypothetical protein
MAAGLGYKEFSTGDVLTAADANGYLASQVVMVFASAAARTSAIASPQEGMISYLKDTNSTEYYSGSAWVAIGGGASGGMTLLSTTSLSGSSTTVSSINQSYINLFIAIEGMSSSSNNAPYLQYNGITSGYKGQIGFGSTTTVAAGSTNGVDFAIGQAYSASGADNYIIYEIGNYAVSGYHAVTGLSTYFIAAGTDFYTMQAFGGNSSTAAVTSITFVAGSGNFDAGTIKIYGVK